MEQGRGDTGIYVDMRGLEKHSHKRKVDRGREGSLEHLTAASGLSSPTLRDLLSGHDFRSQSPVRSTSRAVRRSPSPLPPVGGSSGRPRVAGECIRQRKSKVVVSARRYSITNAEIL